VKELSTDPSWQVFGKSIYETNQTEVDEIVAEIIAQ
jgi:hypothetical protein